MKNGVRLCFYTTRRHVWTVRILFSDLAAHHVSQVYLKTWTGTNSGSPPTGGGGGTGLLFVPSVSASTHIHLVLFSTRLHWHAYFHLRYFYLYYDSERRMKIGHVKNVVARRLSLDRVDSPVHLYQTNGGHS